MNCQPSRWSWTKSTLCFALCFLILNTVAQAQLPQVLYLPLNEGAGVATADLASPGLPTTVPVLSNANSWNTLDPYLGNASWQGDSSTPALIGLSTLVPHSGDFTIEAALYPDPVLLNAPLSSRTFFVTGTQFKCHLIPNNVDKKYRVYLSTFAFSGFISPPIPLREWTMVSIVYDSAAAQIRTYFDGELVFIGAVLAPIAYTQTTAWKIGQGSNTLKGWLGGIDEFRFWNEPRSGALIRALVHSEIKNLDFAVGSITSPPRRLSRFQYYTTSETVSIEVCNPGQTVIQAGAVIPLTLEVDGLAVATEFFVNTQALNPGNTQPFTFAATADLSGIGSHTVRVVASFPDDQSNNNDLILDFRGGGPGVVSEFPWVEEFEDNIPLPPLFLPPTTAMPFQLPDGWMNTSPFTNSGWRRASIGTSCSCPSTPHIDHTGGYPGVFIGPTGGLRSVETPVIELQGMSRPYLNFWMARGNVFNQTPSSTLTVDITSLTTGVTSTVVAPLASLPGSPKWELHRVDLTPYLGQEIYFTFTSFVVLLPLGLDDVSIVDADLPLSGQAPRPLIASLDIDGASNDHARLIDPLEAGPYRRVSKFPKIIDFTITGLPLQPFILFSGDLNVVNANYGAIGQMDVGGPLDPLSGIPTNLMTWGNGFAPVSSTDLYFFTDATGVAVLPGQLPLAYPPIRRTPFATFQAAVALPTAPYIALTNAVELINW